VVPEIYMLTDSQTDRQADRQTGTLDTYNTALLTEAGVMRMAEMSRDHTPRPAAKQMT